MRRRLAARARMAARLSKVTKWRKWREPRFQARRVTFRAGIAANARRLGRLVDPAAMIFRKPLAVMVYLLGGVT
jgi:hypothetical protein